MWEATRIFRCKKDFPLEGLPSDMPDIAFTKVTPMEGGPFVTMPALPHQKIANRARGHRNCNSPGRARP